MKEQPSNQQRAASWASASQPSFQKKSAKDPFFKPEGSENSFFSKSTRFFPSSFNFSAIPIQRKKNESLPEDLQENMEKSFGQDFTNVNIQKNSQEAVDLNARAFTKGDSVHFAPDEFNPHTEKGKNLIGHEFTHIAQQRGGVVNPTSVMAKGRILNDDKALENEADIFGEKAVKGETISRYSSTSPERRRGFNTNRAISNVVQLDEYDEPDHESSVPHLMRLLDEGNEDNIRAALEGLRRAESAVTETSETTRLFFTTGQDSYNLTITFNEVDEFIRLYERYLLRQQSGQAISLPDEFVDSFNRHFGSIQHVFRPRPASPSSIGSSAEEASESGEPESSAGTTSTVGTLSAHEIAVNFTPYQVTLLSQYFDSNTIPERLFNGDEANLLDAGQRIVISAHILANGRYDSGFRLQRVHARMCFHWAHMVYHYAGVTPPGGPLTFRVMGTTDPTGQVMLGGGSQEAGRRGEDIEAPERQASRERDLEAARMDMEDVRGPYDAARAYAQKAMQVRDSARQALLDLVARQQQEIRDASPQDRPELRRQYRAAVATARQRLTDANQELQRANRGQQTATRPFNQAVRTHRRMEQLASRTFIRHEALLPDEIRNLQRGDWLYIYNDNDSRSGDHSVIFSRWLRFVEVSPTRVYGHAELYSQGSSEGGGRAHTTWIGSFTGQEGGHNVHAITRFSRVSSASNPADTADEILSSLSSRTLERAENQNRQFIERHNLDRSAVMQRLAELNHSLLDSLAWRITPNQRALLLRINQEDNLERRVQLNERLRNLLHNVSTSESGRARSAERARSQYEPRLARRRESARELLGGLTERFNSVDETLHAFEAAIMDRPAGVVPNRRLERAGYPTTLDADAYAEEIGLTDAANAVEQLNTLLQRETVSFEEGVEESRQIDRLGTLFSPLSARIPPPGIRQHLGNLRRSTRQNKNDINPPSSPSDFSRWRDACVETYRALDLAIRQLQNRGLMSFARTMRRQGGTLPYVTSHIGDRGERYSSTALLENVPDISNIQSE